MLKCNLHLIFFILFLDFPRYYTMKFFITAIFSFFISLGFSQENLTHTVRKGESLYSISKKYKVSVSDLELLNPAAKKGLAVNSVLQISVKNEEKKEKDAKAIFPKETWNDLHLQIIWYGREYSPARGWDLEKDIITKTIGRKSVLKEYDKKNAPK